MYLCCDVPGTDFANLYLIQYRISGTSGASTVNFRVILLHFIHDPCCLILRRDTAIFQLSRAELQELLPQLKGKLSNTTTLAPASPPSCSAVYSFSSHDSSLIEEQVVVRRSTISSKDTGREVTTPPSPRCLALKNIKNSTIRD